MRRLFPAAPLFFAMMTMMGAKAAAAGPTAQPQAGPVTPPQAGAITQYQDPN